MTIPLPSSLSMLRYAKCARRARKLVVVTEYFDLFTIQACISLEEFPETMDANSMAPSGSTIFIRQNSAVPSIVSHWWEIGDRATISISPTRLALTAHPHFWRRVFTPRPTAPSTIPGGAC